jgi:hypothetical protein
LFIIRIILKEIFPTIYLYDLLRYTVMGLWVFFFAPLVFNRLLQEKDGIIFSK